MATPPWTPAQAAEFEVEKVRLLARADDVTRSFYLPCPGHGPGWVGGGYWLPVTI